MYKIRVGDIVYYRTPVDTIAQTTVLALIYGKKHPTDEHYITVSVYLATGIYIDPKLLYNHFREDGKLINCV